MGKWITGAGIESMGKYTCSKCGYTFFACPGRGETIKLDKFCPECGEKMEGDFGTMTDKQVFETALKRWGPEAQIVMVFEEMSELQKELCKYARGTGDVDHIAEEIADVQIMLEQMIVLHNCERATADYKDKKIDRLKGRLGIYE